MILCGRLLDKFLHNILIFLSQKSFVSNIYIYIYKFVFYHDILFFGHKSIKIFN